MTANGNAAVSAPPDELCCPLSGVLMADPVILVDTGDTYNRRSIEDWRFAPLPCPHLLLPGRSSSGPREAAALARVASPSLPAYMQDRASRHCSPSHICRAACSKQSCAMRGWHPVGQLVAPSKAPCTPHKAVRLPQVRAGPGHGPVNRPAAEEQPADRQHGRQEARVQLAARAAGGAGAAAPETQRRARGAVVERLFAAGQTHSELCACAAPCLHSLHRRN